MSPGAGLSVDAHGADPIQPDRASGTLAKVRVMRPVGKRRMAREMALQMLYQQDLGGATATQIFQAFDRSPYLGGNGDGRRSGGGTEEGARATTEAQPRRPASAAGEHRRREVEEAFTYARELVQGTLDHLDEVNRLIREQADNWRLERMPAVDRNILRLAVYELLYEEGIPRLVVVDEAIELAKKFSTDQSGRFVNGLLDGLLKRDEVAGARR